MKTKTCVALVGLAGGFFAGFALGQDTTITFSIKWDKPTIGAGETNTGAVWAEITPGLGSSIKWTTPPGKGQQGTIVAFASTVFDTMNLLNGGKGQLKWTVLPDWATVGIPGEPDGNGGIKGTNAGQVAEGGLNPQANKKNPVQLLSLTWTAQAGGMYDVAYGLSSKSGKMYLNIGTGFQFWVAQAATFRVDGQSGFSVIPAPAAWCVAGLSTLLACRRRR